MGQEAFYDSYVPRQIREGINIRHISIINNCIRFGLKPGHRVLEIGCGVGTVSSLLGDYLTEGSLLAVDISEESIAAAKENFHRPNITFEVLDLTNSKFDDTFDFVVMPDVLEHIPIDLHNSLFNNLNEVTNKDSTVLIHIPNPHYVSWFLEHRPELAQEIEQSLHVDLLAKNFYSNQFYLHHLENYSLWFKPEDYQIIVLKKAQDLIFNQIPIVKPDFMTRVKNKISRTLRV
jgi:cyclopropane fatty-acyl-phospholipid synthase-like methyltransferase